MEFVIKKDSWHYRWLAFYYCMVNAVKEYKRDSFIWRKKKHPFISYVDFYEDECASRPYEFCMYWRHVLLWPAIRIGFNLFCFFLLFASISLNEGEILTSAFHIILFSLLVIGLIFVIFAVLLKLKSLYQKQRRALNEFREEKDPNFLETIYISYKEKFCPAIRYEDK